VLSGIVHATKTKTAIPHLCNRSVIDVSRRCLQEKVPPLSVNRADPNNQKIKQQQKVSHTAKKIADANG
jgi:hypothetical protein